MPNKPSFILFITDQQQAGMLGCAGDPLVQTPNIDSIAASGKRFDRFYVAMPSCMPNRAAIMTGLYPSVNGVRFNGIPLPVHNATFPQLFHEAGYRTGLVGKGHLQPILEPFEEDDGNGRQWWRNEIDQRGRHLLPPYYGYDSVSIVTGHGDHCGGHYEAWLEERLPDFRDHIGKTNQLPHNYTCPQAIRTRLPEELYSTNYIADQATAFLDDQSISHSDKPFILVVSFPDPHHPFNPPGKYWDMYCPDDVVLPFNFTASDDGLPHLAAARAARVENADNRESYGAVTLGEHEAREAIALTYGMITMIDAAIGRVRAKLSELSLESDTVQIFTSDHGDLLGDHGLMLKGPLHYQSLIRVPFIVSDPDEKWSNDTESGLFSSVDIGVSLLDRAGIDHPDRVHGQSIFHSLKDEEPHRDALLIEDEYQSPVLCFETPPTVRTLVTDKWRMTVFTDENWGELYDLENDPGEEHNLWSDPGHTLRKSALLESLISKMAAVTDRRLAPRSLA